MSDQPGGLGRIHRPDPRDANYPIRSLVTAPPPVIVKARYYRSGPILDQGQTPTCVGHAWRQFLTSAPDMFKKPAPDAFAIYAAAQALDGDPAPHDGTTVRAGAKALQAESHLLSYHWANTTAAVRDFIEAGGGTIVLGVDWYEAMFQPDKAGFCRIGGAIAGGHAFLCRGYDPKRAAFRCDNSWGKAWGQEGQFWLAAQDLSQLLAANGEACAALEVRE